MPTFADRAPEFVHRAQPAPRVPRKCGRDALQRGEAAEKPTGVPRPFADLSQESVRLPREFDEAAQKFVEVTQEIAEVPEKFTEVPCELGDVPQKFAEVPGKFTE